MAAGDLMVAGRRFRTREDYEAALRDQKKIEAIKARMEPTLMMRYLRKLKK